MGKQEQTRNWTITQRRYIEWLALPSMERFPLTQGGFAREVAVNEATLWKWRKLPGFVDEVQKIIKESLGDALHDVMWSFKEQAKKGSFPHQKMYFEMMGLYSPTLNISIIRQEAQRLADEYGLDVDEVIAEAERHALGAGVTR